MADFGYITIRGEFYNWLKDEATKKKSGLNYEEVEKTGAQKSVVKYGDLFKEFLEKREDYDEISLSKDSSKLDIDESDMFDEMFEDYTSSLSKDDSVFKFIDSNADGVISNQEKNDFFSKIKELDKKSEDVSFDDFVSAIEKIEAGETDFYSEIEVSPSVETPQVANISASSGGGSYGGGGGGGGDFDSPTVPTTVEVDEYPYPIVPAEQMESGTYDIDTNVETKEQADEQLTAAYSNYNYCKTYAGEVDEAYSQSENLFNTSKQNFNEAVKQSADAESQLAAFQETIDTTEQEIVAGEGNLTSLNEELNSNTEALNGVREQLTLNETETQDVVNNLSNVEAKISEIGTPTKPSEPSSDASQEEKNQYSSAYSEYQSQIQALESLKSEKAQLEQQKAELEQQKVELQAQQAEYEKLVQEGIDAIGQQEENLVELSTKQAENYAAMDEAIQADEKLKETLGEISSELSENAASMYLVRQTKSAVSAETARALGYVELLESKKMTLPEESAKEESEVEQEDEKTE